MTVHHVQCELRLSNLISLSSVGQNEIIYGTPSMPSSFHKKLKMVNRQNEDNTGLKNNKNKQTNKQ